MARQLIIAALISVGLLMGNGFGQKKDGRPEVQMPGTFRGSDTIPTDAASLGDLKWFDVFKDEELQRLVKTAVERN